MYVTRNGELGIQRIINLIHNNSIPFIYLSVVYFRGDPPSEL